MNIVFTKRAINNYSSIKDYIIKEWGKKVADAFEQKTFDFLDLLEDFPEIGTIELPEKQIRGFQLTKQIRIFYRIKKEQIIILSLFNVRQDPKKKL
jgi:plasmid stabilization system protein ParE